MPDILHAIQIAAPPDAIFPLVSSANGFAQWWAEDSVAAGDAAELGFFNRATIYLLRPQIHQPPSRAEWLCETGQEWNGTRIVFALEPRNAETLLRFSHAGWRAPSDFFTSCNTTWGALMFRLQAVAEGKSCGPLFLRDRWSY